MESIKKASFSIYLALIFGYKEYDIMLKQMTKAMDRKHFIVCYVS